MSTYLGGRQPARRGRRSHWSLAGGLAAGSLVAAVAGLGGAAASPPDRPLPAPDLARPAALSTDQGPHRDSEPVDQGPHRDTEPAERGGRWQRPDNASPGGRNEDPSARPPAANGRPARHKPVQVPCDSARLIAALVRVNAEGAACCG